jgi:hypothetical protein
MATDAKVTSLTAVGGVGQITLAAIAAPPAGMECLAYMQPAKVEFWAASSNNRNSASKIGESASGLYTHGGLSASLTRYYWARAVDNDGNLGAYYPASTTGGVSATTLTTTPGPNSVGTTELKDDAVTAGKMSVSQLSAITANIGDITAGTVTGITFTGGVFQTAMSGQRILIRGVDNYIKVYGSDGSMKAAIGESTDYNAVIGANRTSAGSTAVFSNAGTGRALATTGQAGLFGDGNRPAVLAAHVLNTGSDSHGIRASGGPTGDGQGLVGSSDASGGYAFYAESGTVGPFTGSHPGFILKAAEAVPGDILVDVKVIGRKSIDDTVTEVAASSDPAQRNVIGVLSKRRPFEADALMNPFTQSKHDAEPSFLRKHLAEKYDLVTINGVGEGQMNVCGLGGDIEAGDFICASAMLGKGQRQNDERGDADDTPRRRTVARARESVIFSDLSAVKRVAVVYLCG